MESYVNGIDLYFKMFNHDKQYDNNIHMVNWSCLKFQKVHLLWLWRRHINDTVDFQDLAFLNVSTVIAHAQN